MSRKQSHAETNWPQDAKNTTEEDNSLVMLGSPEVGGRAETWIYRSGAPMPDGIGTLGKRGSRAARRWAMCIETAAVRKGRMIARPMSEETIDEVAWTSCMGQTQARHVM
jgi:hypothetical protein